MSELELYSWHLPAHPFSELSVIYSIYPYQLFVLLIKYSPLHTALTIPEHTDCTSGLQKELNNFPIFWGFRLLIFLFPK